LVVRLKVLLYAKVFAQIFDSSIADDYRLRHFFMDLLVLSDQNGVVDMTSSAIAARTRIPLPDVVEMLSKLEAPDTESRTPDHGGRRLVKIDDHRTWGWHIVNYEAFRNIATEEQRRLKTRERVARFKLKQKALGVSNGEVTLANAQVTPPSAYAYACTSPSESSLKGESEGGTPAKVEGLPELRETIQKTARLAGEIKNIAKTQVHSGRRPATIEDALARASMIGVLEQDCRDWYRDCEACDWKRGDGTPFDNWVRQLCIHRDKLAEKRAKGGSTVTGRREPSIMDIKTVIQVKEDKAKALRERHSVEGPVNTEWRDAEAKAQYFALRKEIKILKTRIEGMV
jgi:hypothetical protein